MLYPRRSSRATLTIALLVGTAIGSGCRDSGPESAGSARFPPGEERARQATEAVEVASSPPEALFSTITALDLDSDGNIYVGDWNNKAVTVLSSSGKLLRTVGRDGEGPGEFRSVSKVEVLPGDSLQVYDLQLSRLTVFAPHSDQVAYTLNLGGRNTSAFDLWRKRSGAGMVATYRRFFSTNDDPRQDAQRVDILRLLGLDGLVQKDSILVFPSPVMLVLRDQGRVSVTSDPFGRRGIARMGPGDRLFYAWTDTPTVRIFSAEGDSIGAFSIPFSAPAVTPADLERVLGDRKEAFRRAITEAAPQRWPAIQNMVIDDQGRVWIALASPFDQPVEWAVFSDAGRYLGSVRLPAGTSISLVRGDRAYAVASDELDVPRVVVYRIGRDLGAGARNL